MLDSARSLDALDRIGEGIFALDADGRIAYVNRTAQRLLPPLIGAVRRAARHGHLGRLAFLRPDARRRSPFVAPSPTAFPVVHTLRDPATGQMLELRLFPSEEGMSGLLLESAPAPRRPTCWTG